MFVRLTHVFIDQLFSDIHESRLTPTYLRHELLLSYQATIALQ